MDLVSVLRAETGSTAKIVTAVTTDQLGHPTPCPSFDVRALINHMCMGNHFVARAVDGEKTAPDYERDFVGSDHAAAYGRSRAEVLRAFEAPDALDRTVTFPIGDVTAQFAINFAFLEALVHRWDLAHAIGVDAGIDDTSAGMVLEWLRQEVTDALRAPAPELTTRDIPLGPAVDIPETATAPDKLLAFVGRTP